MKKIAKPAKKHGGPRPGSGRPKSANPRTVNLGLVRLTPAEREELAAQARAAGQTLTAWVRERLGLGP